MHGLASQLADIRLVAAALTGRFAEADVLICPPLTLIDRAVAVAGGRIGIGGQNCHHDDSGAYTGEVSATMLRDAGASAVIIGHSERRQQYGETDAMVASKARAAARVGLLAIICIGETQAQRTAGQALAVCAKQISLSVPDELSALNGVIGYEPLWAVGSGRTPNNAEICDMHAHIRLCLRDRLGAAGESMRILYGGSVKPDNARSILALPQVGGALVGGASLNAANFEAIVRAASP